MYDLFIAAAVPSVPKSHEPTALPDVAAPYCVPVQSVDTTTSPSQPGQYNKLQHHEPTALPRVAVPYCVPVQNADVSSPLLQPNQYHKLQHVFNRHLSSSSMPCLCREVLLSTQPSAGFGFRIRGGREEGFIPTVVSVTPGEAADNAGLSVSICVPTSMSCTHMQFYIECTNMYIMCSMNNVLHSH